MSHKDIDPDLLKTPRVSFSELKGNFFRGTRNRRLTHEEQSELNSLARQGRAAEKLIKTDYENGARSGRLGSRVFGRVVPGSITLEAVDEQTGVTLSAIPDMVAVDDERTLLVEIKNRSNLNPLDLMQAVWANLVARGSDNPEVLGKDVRSVIYLAESDTVVDVDEDAIQRLSPFISSIVSIWRILSKPKGLKREARVNYKRNFIEQFLDWRNQAEYIAGEED